MIAIRAADLVTIANALIARMRLNRERLGVGLVMMELQQPQMVYVIILVTIL